MRINLACAECGDNHFRLDTVESDETLITCQACGHVIGTLGDVKERVAEEVMAHAAGLNPASQPSA